MRYKAASGAPAEDLQFVPTHPAMQARDAYIQAERPAREPPAWGFKLRDREAVPVVHTERGIGNTANFGEHLATGDVTDAVAEKRARYATLMLLLFCPFTVETDLRCGRGTWDPWQCFLHAKSTGALRPMASSYMKHAQLFHVRFLRNPADLLALPAVPGRAPIANENHGEDGAGPHRPATQNDDEALDALHAMATTSSAEDSNLPTHGAVPRRNADAYADPAATKASVQRNSVFATRQDSALHSGFTRDRLLRTGTLTDALLVDSEDVAKHHASIEKWANMLRGTDDVVRPARSEDTNTGADGTHYASDPSDSTAWQRFVSVEIARCFNGSASDSPRPGGSTHLLSIDEVGVGCPSRATTGRAVVSRAVTTGRCQVHPEHTPGASRKAPHGHLRAVCIASPRATVHSLATAAAVNPSTAHGARLHCSSVGNRNFWCGPGSHHRNRGAVRPHGLRGF